MAYFPNGTAGACYDEEFCASCIHGVGEEGCTVMLLHDLYNYQQFEDDERGRTIKSMLEALIPSEGLGAAQCTMFAPTADPEAEAAEQRRLAEQPRKYAEIMAERRAA